jgi:hypothetical protein
MTQLDDLNTLDADTRKLFQTAFGAVWFPSVCIALLHTRANTHPRAHHALSKVLLLSGLSAPSRYVQTLLKKVEYSSLVALRLMNMFGREEFDIVVVAQCLLGCLLYGAPLVKSKFEGADGKSCVVKVYRRGFHDRLEVRFEKLRERSRGVSDPRLQEEVTALERLIAAFRMIEEKHMQRGVLYQIYNCPPADGHLRRCGHVGCTETPIGACGRCQCARYCSRKCQRIDWGGHRFNCYRTNLLGMS